jgi:hypothetical protein
VAKQHLLRHYLENKAERKPMSALISFILLSLYSIYLFTIAVRNIMIGMGKIRHPMYDTVEKQKYILKKGKILAILSIIVAIFFITLTFASTSYLLNNMINQTSANSQAEQASENVQSNAQAATPQQEDPNKNSNNEKKTDQKTRQELDAVE